MSSVGRKIKRYEDNDCHLLSHVRLNHISQFQGDDGDVSPERETSLYGESAPSVRDTFVSSLISDTSSEGESPRFSDYVPVRFIDEGAFGAVS